MATEIFHVVIEADLQKIKQMLDQGEDFNRQNDVGASPLHFACETGRADVATLLLDNNVDVNAADFNLQVPLMLNMHHQYAAHLFIPRLHFIVLLVKDAWRLSNFLPFGALISTGRMSMETPLFGACIFGYEGVVATLLNANANVNAKDTAGATPLHYAALNGHKDVVAALLNAGASPLIQDNAGKLAVHLAKSEQVKILFS